MTASDPRQVFADRKRSRVKAGLVVAAAVIVAASGVAIWVSPGPFRSALVPAVRPAADSREEFNLAPFATPREIENVAFEDGQGRKRTLADFRGKVVLLNLWATWCGPCRQEMPTLDRLQQQLGSVDFEVVALSIDRGGQSAVKSFFDEIDTRALAVYVDATAEAGTRLGIIGVPTTLLLDRTGREVGRVTGPAQWDSPAVITTIKRYLPPRPQ